MKLLKINLTCNFMAADEWGPMMMCRTRVRNSICKVVKGHQELYIQKLKKQELAVESATLPQDSKPCQQSNDIHLLISSIFIYFETKINGFLKSKVGLKSFQAQRNFALNNGFLYSQKSARGLPHPQTLQEDLKH